MSASGLTQLTIRIAKNWMTQSRASSLGTEMATLSGPTEQASNRVDLLRTGVLPVA